MIQQWAHWLHHSLGTSVLESEQNFLSKLLAERYGKHTLLIGVPEQYPLLKYGVLSSRVILSPLINRNKNIKYIESEYYELPVIPGSIDLVLLPHTLEFIDNPRQLLMEACRVVKPEGDIMIFCFNPFSLWGLKKWWENNKHIPWSGRFIPASTIKNWLALADFELIRQDMIMFYPPIGNPHIFQKFKFLEWMGTHLHLFFGGGIFVITARAKEIPLTPIKLKWQQKLSTISATLPGSTSMRDMRR
jgi:SAM-dependent methyltransferase